MSRPPIDTEFVLTINGESVTTDDRAPVYDPATRRQIATVPIATPAHLDEAVAAAEAAYSTWSRTPLAQRQAAVSAIGDRIEEHAEEFMALLTAEQGKPRAMAEWEVYGSIAWFREIAKQELPVEVLEDSADRRVISRHTPLGVVGAIVPWNFPILLMVWKIAPALVAGDTMIVNPSPFTPLCDLKLIELVQDLLPAGVLSALGGDDDLGTRISRIRTSRRSRSPAARRPAAT